MLAALLENNNNTRPAAQSFKVDPRRSGGRSRLDRGGSDSPEQRFNLVDIAAALAVFPEIAGEHPGARTARRARWVSEALPFIKEAREKREAAAFLLGAQIGAAAEREAAAEAAKEAAATRDASVFAANQIEQLIQIVDEVRARQPPARRDRGAGTMGGVLAIGLLAGVAFGVAIASRPKRKRG